MSAVHGLCPGPRGGRVNAFDVAAILVAAAAVFGYVNHRAIGLAARVAHGTDVRVAAVRASRDRYRRLRHRRRRRARRGPRGGVRARPLRRAGRSDDRAAAGIGPQTP